MENLPRIENINGEIVLIDPEAVSVIKAVEKSNCINTFHLNIDRIVHFRNRINERHLTNNDVVIVIINVDAPFGLDIANALMPNFNWQDIRDRGEIPFARGLALREYMQKVLDIIDKEAALKLKENLTETMVVIVDHGVAEVYDI